MKRLALFFIVLFLPCAACAGGTHNLESKGPELRLLTAAVESYIRYSMPPGMTDEQEILRQATAHDPSLLEPFRDYHLRVKAVDRHGVVLVCTKDRRQALMEDSGCAAPLEREYWRNREYHPCVVSFTPKDVCLKR